MQKTFLPNLLIFSALTGCGLLTQEPAAKWLSSFSVAEGLELVTEEGKKLLGID